MAAPLQGPVPIHAVLRDRALVSYLLGLLSHGARRALGGTCARWRADVRSFAPEAARVLALLTQWPPALRDAAAGPEGRRREQEARRARLLESLRMCCQDPGIPGAGAPAEGAEHGALRAARGAAASAGSHWIGSFPGQAGGGPGRGSARSAVGGGGAVEDVSMSSIEWFRSAIFQDRGTTDDELCAALRQAAPGEARRLVLCSSKLTDEGVLRATEPHWPWLADLCASACARRAEAQAGLRPAAAGPSPGVGHQLVAASSGKGSGSEARAPSSALLAAEGEAAASQPSGRAVAAGAMTGGALAPLARRRLVVGPGLRSLVLVDLPAIDACLQGVACAGTLQTLMVRGCIGHQSIEAIAACRGLEVLKLSLVHKAVQGPFMTVFRSCQNLRVIDIHGATDVSDQLLECLMLSTPRLADFSGSYSAPGNTLAGALDPAASLGRSLSQRQLHAFSANFPMARIFVDNRVEDSLL